jgi:vitamin B12/bleomycin/antimicrobial peptide transport system ATP-binding/permease protein
LKNLSSTLAIVWRIASPYFRSDDKWAGGVLLASVIGIELASVGVTVLLNTWNARFYNSLQERNWDRFIDELLFAHDVSTWRFSFCILATTWIILKVYQLYLNQWLQIRWRRWMTTRYLGLWLHDASHYRMQLVGDAADNPDQRIAEDVKQFIEGTLSIGIGLLSSIVSLASFTVILWGLSGDAPLHLFGVDYAIPGYLFWGALIYAVLGTAFTHLVGRPLVSLNFQLQRLEADFRFNLVRVRENSEQIALLQGEAAERGQLLLRFRRVVDNWMEIMRVTKRITFFTAGYGQAAVVFPFILVAPAYFADKMQLGGMMQTASAFGSVQDALSFFVTSYRTIAEWRSVVARLDGFEGAIKAADQLPRAPDTIKVVPQDGKNEIAIRDLFVRLPGGQPLVSVNAFTVEGTERVLVIGPSGAGKSTLFRAIAGIWPFGHGTVTVPAKATFMMLPQRPYFPVATLKDAVAYPQTGEDYSDAVIRDVVTAIGLPALAARLHEEGHWNRMLSLGEQQRLGIARALLRKPQYLFLDEATASLDEPSEAALYMLLEKQLASSTIVSIGHRTTLHAFHSRSVTLVRDGDEFALTERVGAAAS